MWYIPLSEEFEMHNKFLKTKYYLKGWNDILESMLAKRTNNLVVEAEICIGRTKVD